MDTEESQCGQPDEVARSFRISLSSFPLVGNTIVQLQRMHIRAEATLDRKKKETRLALLLTLVHTCARLQGAGEQVPPQAEDRQVVTRSHTTEMARTIPMQPQAQILGCNLGRPWPFSACSMHASSLNLFLKKSDCISYIILIVYIPKPTKTPLKGTKITIQSMREQPGHARHR